MAQYIKITLNIRQSVFDFLDQEAKSQDISLSEVVADALGYYICFRKAKKKDDKTMLLLDDASGKLHYLQKQEIW